MRLDFISGGSFRRSSESGRTFLKRIPFHPLRPLDALYDEAGLEAYKRRGLNWIMRGNLCGNLWGIICGSGLLTFCQNRGLFAGAFDRYKALFLISSVLRFICVLLFVPQMPNENETTAKDLLSSVLGGRGRG